jgi:carboxylesterase
MPEPDVMSGAAAWSSPGGPHGALVLHGFTGNPQSMRGLAEAFARAGFTVELPRLPGHGTTIDDMTTTTWDDWSAAAEAAFVELASRVERIVVAGLSMGGGLTLWLASRHPDVAGIVLINAIAEPSAPEIVTMIRQMLADGATTIDAIGNDIAEPGQVENAYDKTPLAAAASMFDAIDALQSSLGSIRCPALVMNSPQDHVVQPSNSDHLAATLGGPVERVSLERSYHVATLDYDRDLIEERAVEFAVRVCGS